MQSVKNQLKLINLQRPEYEQLTPRPQPVAALLQRLHPEEAVKMMRLIKEGKGATTYDSALEDNTVFKLEVLSS
jgi:hypothetical protein